MAEEFVLEKREENKWYVRKTFFKDNSKELEKATNDLNQLFEQALELNKDIIFMPRNNFSRKRKKFKK